MKKYKIIILGLIIITSGLAFHFKDNILNIYNKSAKNLHNFENLELGTIVNEFKKEILAPSPLKVGGKENQVVLTKAKIIAQTNIQRYDNGGLPPLIENTTLDVAAKAKAEDMFLHQYFEHVSPSGVDPGRLVKNYGYDYIVSGENLILGNFKDEAEVLQRWMDSPGHRANILNNRYTDIGVAMVKGTYQGNTIWIGVQEFGLPLSTCSKPDSNVKNQIEINKNTLDELSLKIDNKRKEIDNTNQRSPQYNVLVDEYNMLVNEYNSLNQEIKNLIIQYNNQINIFNQCITG